MSKILMPSPWDGSQAEGKPIHPVLMDVKAADLKRFPERRFSSFQDVAARFWSRVQVVEDLESCWEWRYVYKTSKKERPQFKLNGDVWLAHRLAYRITYGRLPAYLKVCHHCDNPKCSNPNHFFLGTQGDNVRDCVEKKRNLNSVPEEIVRSIRANAHTASVAALARTHGISAVYAKGLIDGAHRKDVI